MNNLFESIMLTILGVLIFISILIIIGGTMKIALVIIGMSCFIMFTGWLISKIGDDL